jgi:hypothetical protein
MSAPNPVIGLTTAAVTQQLQGQEADSIVLYLVGTWGVGETCEVRLPAAQTTSNIPFIDPFAATPVILSSGGPVSVVIPGGILYAIVKSGTAAAAGVDCQLKPRQGS